MKQTSPSAFRACRPDCPVMDYCRLLVWQTQWMMKPSANRKLACLRKQIKMMVPTVQLYSWNYSLPTRRLVNWYWIDMFSWCFLWYGKSGNSVCKRVHCFPHYLQVVCLAPLNWPQVHRIECNLAIITIDSKSAINWLILQVALSTCLLVAFNCGQSHWHMPVCTESVHFCAFSPPLSPTDCRPSSRSRPIVTLLSPVLQMLRDRFLIEFISQLTRY